jgi:hypothetical protein
VRLAVREKVVNQHADNRKQEHDKRPEDLVGDGAVRLEDLNCEASALTYYNTIKEVRRTPSNNIQYQHNEPNNAATGTRLPRLRGRDAHGCGFDKREEREVEEEGDGEVHHFGGDFCVFGDVRERDE